MKIITAAIVLLNLSFPALAGVEGFTKGPVFTNYGENVAIENGVENAKTQYFKVMFDISSASEAGTVNRSFNTVARFINMHVRAGVPKENIEVAMVIHGKAGLDVLSKSAHRARFQNANPNEELVGLLLEEKVKVFICGQSASYLDIKKADLAQGVQMSLSAMTASSLLQQQGYSLNPF